MATYNQGGNPVTPSAIWTAGDTAINLGELSLTVDAEDLGALSDFTSKQIGSIGAGDGKNVAIGYLALVKFANPSGLSQDGEGYYLETSNSGKAVATSAGNKGTGTLISGSLESSNVDLSQQLTEMIITQRGFQANTRMITTSDEMLSELVSMKR
jgi:flagellar hook protein FlgE